MHCFCIVALGKYFKSMTCFFLCMTRTALRNIVSFYFNQHLISEQVCWKIVVPCRVNASKLLLTVFCTKKLNTFGENHLGKKLCSFSVYDLFFQFLACRIHLPGQYYELNVHFGVFVGGMGNFTEIFFGNQENFRGCLESIYFNGVDVLAKAKVIYMK